MSKYGLHGKHKALDGKGEVLTSILLDASQLMSKAKGCDLYVVSMDVNNTDCIWITEVWDSKEDHDNSLNIRGVKELISRALPILDGTPEKGQELVVLGGI